MTEFEVACESECLCHCDISPCLEHHHCDRASGEGVADDEFGDDVKADLLVRNCLDHADGDDVEKGWEGEGGDKLSGYQR